MCVAAVYAVWVLLQCSKAGFKRINEQQLAGEMGEGVQHEPSFFCPAQPSSLFLGREYFCTSLRQGQTTTTRSQHTKLSLNEIVAGCLFREMSNLARWLVGQEVLQY